VCRPALPTYPAIEAELFESSAPVDSTVERSHDDETVVDRIETAVAATGIDSRGRHRG